MRDRAGSPSRRACPRRAEGRDDQEGGGVTEAPAREERQRCEVKSDARTDLADDAEILALQTTSWKSA